MFPLGRAGNAVDIAAESVARRSTQTKTLRERGIRVPRARNIEQRIYGEKAARLNRDSAERGELTRR